MKKFALLLVGIPLVLGGCQNQDSENALLERQRAEEAELTGVEHDIAVNILASRFGGYRAGQEQTRAMGEFTLTPYVVDGDTLLYIAQYDKGWEIYSASHAANMVLFSSDEGRFDMEDPSLPEQLRFLITENAAAIGEIPEDTDYIDPSWGGIALTDEELSQGNITVLEDGGTRRKIKEGDLPPGHWILIEVEETGSETHTTPKLIKTKWGQSAPWNAYAKWVPTYTLDGTVWKQCLAGCSPVAISQYMYFTHFKDGVPEKSVTSAIQTIESTTGNRSDYVFRGEDSKVWDKMAKYSSETGTTESALLIGMTGRKLKSDYGLEGTATLMVDNGLPFLKDTYGFQFTRKLITYGLIKESLCEKGYPLLASVFSNKKSDGTNLDAITGHTMIIDQYREITKTFRYVYAWERDPLPPGTVDRWVSDLKDANGNIIKYAYTNEITESTVYSSRISMNWGAYGLYDQTFYSLSGDWNAGEYNYNLEHYVYTRGD